MMYVYEFHGLSKRRNYHQYCVRYRKIYMNISNKNAKINHNNDTCVSLLHNFFSFFLKKKCSKLKLNLHKIYNNLLFYVLHYVFVLSGWYTFILLCQSNKMVITSYKRLTSKRPMFSPEIWPNWDGIISTNPTVEINSKQLGLECLLRKSTCDLFNWRRGTNRFTDPPSIDTK